jgi:hypothetical protein
MPQGTGHERTHRSASSSIRRMRSFSLSPSMAAEGAAAVVVVAVVVRALVAAVALRSLSSRSLRSASSRAFFLTCVALALVSGELPHGGWWLPNTWVIRASAHC